MKTFTEQLQEAVGATYPLEDILQNLTPEQILDEVNIFAKEVAKEALRNAFELIPKDFYLTDAQWEIIKGILDESNIPNV